MKLKRKLCFFAKRKPNRISILQGCLIQSQQLKQSASDRYINNKINSHIIVTVICQSILPRSAESSPQWNILLFTTSYVWHFVRNHHPFDLFLRKLTQLVYHYGRVIQTIPFYLTLEWFRDRKDLIEIRCSCGLPSL